VATTRGRRGRRRYDGRIALITGASSGIGRAIALELAARGAVVIGLARRRELLTELEAELTARSPRSAVVVCDVADTTAYRAVLAAIIAERDRIDILVNNAGIDIMLPALSGNEEAVRRNLEVNFFATVAGTLAVLPAMAARGQGVVVNVSSDTARAAEPRQGGYAASKAAVSAFTESIAHEMVSHGVHVHVLYPGWVPTAMGLPSDADNGALPPKLVRRTAEGVATLLAERMGGPHIDINAARLPLLAPIVKHLLPRAYQRAMRSMNTT
jgi:NAD(P)-dependent dehydrogenase (short-subunit alcohol dehydrogenase family)